MKLDMKPWNTMWKDLIPCVAPNQHAGKNFFDQQLFKEALSSFQTAQRLREERGAHPDQIASTIAAIEVTLQKLNHIK